MSSILAHDLSTHFKVYNEHMAQGAVLFFQAPAILDCLEGERFSEESLPNIRRKPRPLHPQSRLV